MSDIEQPDMRRFVVNLQERGLSASSIRKYVAPLKVMFATAVEDGDLPVNPATGLRINAQRVEMTETEPAKAMTRVELAKLLPMFEDRWQVLFELLAHTGLRISELLGLDWEDLAFGNSPRLRIRRQYYRGTLKLHPKTDAGRRTLPLSPGMARKLWAVRPAHASGPMFVTASGRRILDRNLRRVLDRATEKRGLEWVGFHTFRHTCASMLLESGKNIRQIAAWLGHEDPAFTLRTYTHLMDAGLGDVAFLDVAVRFLPDEEAVPVGNKWATQDPQTAANAHTSEMAEMAG